MTRIGKGIVVKEPPVKPLTALEWKRLEQLEGVVVENFKSFVQAGQALAEIRDRQLYRERDITFDRYVKGLFDIGARRAYQLIDAANVVQNVNNCSQDIYIDMVPMNEAQARPLARLRPEQQVSVWKAAVEQAPKGKVTAGFVNKVVKMYLGEKVVKAIRTAQEKVRTAPVSPEFIEAFEAFADQIVREKESGYKLTARAEIVKRLDQLRAEIAEDGDLIEGPAFHGGSDDTNKLLRAGYRLFRTDRSSMTVKEHGGTGWKKHSGPFDTIKAMDEELKAILQDEKHLRG